VSLDWQRARAGRYAAEADVPGFSVLIWKPGAASTIKRLTYPEPADALTAAVDYLKAGYQVRLADEAVEHFRAERTVDAAPWFPNMRDWKLLCGMLGRAIETPGFFHVTAEAAGRGEAERLRGRISDVIARIARHMLWAASESSQRGITSCAIARRLPGWLKSGGVR